MTTEIELKAEIGKFISNISQRFFDHHMSYIESETFYIEFIRYLKEKAEIKLGINNTIKDDYMYLCYVVVGIQELYLKNNSTYTESTKLLLGKEEVSILERFFNRKINELDLFFGLRIKESDKSTIVKII